MSTKQTILQKFKDAGYTGDAQLVNIQNWLKEKELETDTVEVDGKAINLAEVFTERKAFSFNSAPETKSREVNRITAMIDEKSAPAGIVRGRRVEALKKSYQAKADRGQTRFADADEAELLAAGFRLSFMGTKDYSQRAADTEIMVKGQSVYTNTGGGSLIDPQFLAGLLYVTEPTGACRRLSNVVTMNSDVAWAKRKTGIFTMSHRLPTGSYASSENSYDNVQLTARDVGCIVNVPQNLIDDAAISVIDDLAGSAQEALQKREDADWTIGDGSATYGNQVGLIGALPSSAYINAAGATWASITDANILSLIGSVQNVDLGRCAFLCSRQFYVQVLAKLAQAKGGVTAQEVYSGVVVNGIKANAQYQGFPVVFEQNNLPVASAGTTKSLYFGDFMGGSMLGVRKSIEVAVSEHSSFSTGGVDVRFSARSCINVHGDGKGSTYGPIVALVTI